MELFVNGTLMRGLALHHNLKGAAFLGAVRTAPRYRLYDLPGLTPPRPGLQRVGDAEAASGAGGAIAVEVWDVPIAAVGRTHASTVELGVRYSSKGIGRKTIRILDPFYWNG